MDTHIDSKDIGSSADNPDSCHSYQCLDLAACSLDTAADCRDCTDLLGIVVDCLDCTTEFVQTVDIVLAVFGHTGNILGPEEALHYFGNLEVLCS